MSHEIRHRCELHICSKLGIAVPGHRFLPLTGFGLSDSERNLEPPFSVVSITEAIKTHDQYSNFFCTGSVQVVNHANEVGSDQHSQSVEGVYRALSRLSDDESDPTFTFSGISIEKTRSAEDSEHAAHVDAIDFKCSCHEVNAAST